MKDVFAQIETLLPNLGGWTTVEKGQTLAAIVIALRPFITVELGVFAGRSVLSMALAHKTIAFGQVWAVDAWNNEVAIQDESKANVDWWKTVDMESIYQEFLRQVSVTGTGNVVVVKRSKSDDVQPPKSIDLLHVDGSHGPQAVKDVQRFAPHVGVGKIVVLDDKNWDGGHVLRAEQRLLELGFVELYPLGTGAVYQRIR